MCGTRYKQFQGEQCRATNQSGHEIRQVYFICVCVCVRARARVEIGQRSWYGEYAGPANHYRDTQWLSWLRHCTTRWRVRFPMVSLEFLIDTILPAALWP